MIINKKSSLLTFISAAALLALFNNANNQTVHADTVKNKVVVQANNQTNTKSEEATTDTKDIDNTVVTQNQIGGGNYSC